MNYNTNDVVEHVSLNNIYKSCEGNGINTGFDISEDSPQGMDVNIAIGSCFIDGTKYSEIGITNIPITAAHATLNRKDIIVYDASDNAPKVVDGTVGATPIPPDMTDDQILLAIVDVDAAVTTITNSDIKDRRCFVEYTRNIIPIGLIVIWHGTQLDIPSGWYLCDGNNGTPNLQDKFIVGAGSTYAVAATGGNTTHTHLTRTQTTAHGWFQAMAPTAGFYHENHLPPYYALCYIMRGYY